MKNIFRLQWLVSKTIFTFMGIANIIIAFLAMTTSAVIVGSSEPVMWIGAAYFLYGAYQDNHKGQIK